MSRVCLVGAGSVLWAPKILGDFYVADSQPIEQICLMDINPEALDPILALTKLMETKTGRRFKIAAENNLEKAVEGADFIVISISVGGLKAMERDLVISEEHGILATVGDTVGPAGLSRLLRSVPAFLDLAKRIERIAPDAWLINVSNPLTPLTYLISQETALRTVGLCSGIINHLWILKDLLGFEALSELDFAVGGIDHCSWFLDLKVRGRDIYPELRQRTVEELENQASFRYSRDEWANIDSLTAGFRLFRAFGFLPAISDRHLCEFFPFFINRHETLKHYNIKRTTIGHRLEWGKNARADLQGILSGKKVLPLFKSREIVVDVINALAGAGAIRTTINYPNEGQIENLPKGSVVETTGEIFADQIKPDPTGLLPPQLLPAVYPHIVRQELATEAAKTGSPELFIAALTTDPTVQDLSNVQTLADQVLDANREFLPQCSS